MTMPTQTELAKAFYPATLAGLADSWWQENIEIGQLRKARELHESILLEASVKGADMSVDPAWRVGSIIEGTENITADGEVKTVRVQAVWVYDNEKWHPKLRKV